MDSRVLEELRETLEFEGYVPGTEEFEVRLRERQVWRCRELKGMAGCSNCPAFDWCEIVRAHYRDTLPPQQQKSD